MCWCLFFFFYTTLRLLKCLFRKIKYMSTIDENVICKIEIRLRFLMKVSKQIVMMRMKSGQKKTTQTSVKCDKSLDCRIEYSDLTCFVHKITLFDMGFRCQKISVLDRGKENRHLNLEINLRFCLWFIWKMCAFTEYPCQWDCDTIVRRQCKKIKIKIETKLFSEMFSFEKNKLICFCLIFFSSLARPIPRK